MSLVFIFLKSLILGRNVLFMLTIGENVFLDQTLGGKVLFTL